jgi:hypothetical protein
MIDFFLGIIHFPVFMWNAVLETEFIFRNSVLNKYVTMDNIKKG